MVVGALLRCGSWCRRRMGWCWCPVHPAGGGRRGGAHVRAQSGGDGGGAVRAGAVFSRCAGWLSAGHRGAVDDAAGVTVAQQLVDRFVGTLHLWSLIGGFLVVVVIVLAELLRGGRLRLIMKRPSRRAMIRRLRCLRRVQTVIRRLRSSVASSGSSVSSSSSTGRKWSRRWPGKVRGRGGGPSGEERPCPSAASRPGGGRRRSACGRRQPG